MGCDRELQYRSIKSLRSVFKNDRFRAYSVQHFSIVSCPHPKTVSSLLIPFHVPFCHVRAFSCESLRFDGSAMAFSSYMYVEQKALHLEAKAGLPV